MTLPSIHSELEALSGSSPAGYILRSAFARLCLNKLVFAIDQLRGKPLPAGNGRLSAMLRSVDWTTNPNVQLASPISPTYPDKEVDLLVTSDFTVLVDIFVTDDVTQIISEVSLSVTGARAHVRAENNVLILEGSEFQSQRLIMRLPGAETVLVAAGIDPLEAAYVEGHIGYGVVSQAIGMSLGQRHEIKLAELFPAVDFGSALKLAILAGGEALGIVPTAEVELLSSATCQCSEGPDFEITRTDLQSVEPPNPQPGDEVARIEVGGPVAENKDPLLDFGRRAHGEYGLAGLYIPLDFASAMVIDVMPAIKIRARDNGVIGFSAEANVGFKNFRVSIDQAGGGLLLDIDLDISVSAYCDMEIFKGMRLPIGWAIISPAGGSVASIQLGFYPSVDNSGTVRLRGTLKKADMGHYVAVVIGIGTALKLLGVTAWIGFLIDVVLATILSVGLPVALKKTIAKHLGSKEWKLIDGLLVQDPTQGFYPVALYDTRPRSVLASINSAG